MSDSLFGYEVKNRTIWHPAKMGEVTFHPACTKPDVQSETDYARLKEDVGQNGVREPVLVQASSGSVIAGRHRIKAAREVGTPIPVAIIEISDSEAWGLSRSQLCHRNLSATRAAALYVDMKDEEQKALNAEMKENGKDEPEHDEPGAADGREKKAKKAKPKKDRAKKGEGKKSKKEAKEAGVSPAVMERVKKVKAKGVPSLWKAMDAGDVTANDAAYIVDFDHDIQKKCLALVKDKTCKTLKNAKDHLDKEAKKADGPALRDGLRKEVPKKLVPIFEDRGQFAVLREQVLDVAKAFGKLMKRESAKHLPKELATHLDDVAKALDIYQPFAVAEETEDGWITKRDAKE